MIGSEFYCAGGACRHLSRAIADPVAEAVTQVAIAISAVTSTDDDNNRLAW